MKTLFKWIKDKYYGWYINTYLIDGGTGTSDVGFLNPFSGSGMGGVSEDVQITQNQQQRQMAEAMAKIKGRINDKVGDKTKENYHKVLNVYTSSSTQWNEDLDRPDIMDLANDEEVPLWKKIIQRNFIAKKADIVSKKDKKKMIDSRINHYQELQVKKQIRKLNRRLRLAERDGDRQLASHLKGEIRELTRELDSERPSKHFIP